MIITTITNQHSSPMFYGLPKIHKIGTPSGPLHPVGEQFTCGVAKEPANIIQPLVAQSLNQIQNTQQFVDHIKLLHLLPEESMVSYDVKAQFTFILMDPTINIVQNTYTRVHFSHKVHPCPSPQINTLLEFCLKNTYFLLQGQYFEQIDVVTKGSLIRPCIANLVMEEFKVKAINSADHPPHIWISIWMTPLSSKRLNTVTSVSSTSTPWTHTS